MNRNPNVGGKILHETPFTDGQWGEKCTGMQAMPVGKFLKTRQIKEKLSKTRQI